MGALPNLFVVGAAKSGTTALYRYFQQQPEVFVPESIKELNYMAFYAGVPDFRGPGDKTNAAAKSIAVLSDYENLYSARRDEPVSADVSPAYLYFTQAPTKISEMCPDAKIVIILRNPVECAFSMFSMMRRDGREPCSSFLEAFRQSRERLAAGWEWAWDYQGYFLYSNQVRRYLDLFPARQLFVRRYEDLNNTPDRFYRELNQFMGVRMLAGEAINQRVNEGARRVDVMSKNRGGRMVLKAGRMLKAIIPANARAALRKQILEKPAYRLSPEQRRILVRHYSDDIQKLGAMLQWDLSDWLRT